MSEIAIILTVPHAACKNNHLNKGWHMCDEVAPLMADSLYKALSSDPWINNTHIVVNSPLYGSENREDVDLNRTEARGIGIRKELANLFAQMKKDERRIFLFDIHSYDNRAPWVAEDYNPELVLLDDKMSKEGLAKSAHFMHHMVLEMTYTADEKRIIGSHDPEKFRAHFSDGYDQIIPVGGSDMNDIVHHSHELGAEFAVLIEYNEVLLQNPKSFNELSKLTVDAIISLIKSEK